MKCIINRKICTFKNEYLPIFALIYRCAPVYYGFIVVWAIANFVQLQIDVWLIEKIVDIMSHTREISDLWYIVFIFFATELFLFILKCSMEYYQNLLIPRIREKMKLRMSQKMMSVPYFMLEDKNFLDLKDRAMFAITNKGAIYNFVYYFGDIIRNSAILLSVVSIMSKLGFLYILIIGFSVVLTGICYYRYMNYQKDFYDNFVINSRREEMYDEIAFDKNYALDLRINGMKKLLNKKYGDFVRHDASLMQAFYGNKGMYLGIISVIEKMVHAFAYIYIVNIFWIGNGAMLTTGLFAKYISAMTNYSSKTKNICEDIIQLRQMKNYLEPFMLFVNKTNACQASNKIIVNEEVKEIRFENVSFKYPNTSNWALKNVGFIIKNGESLSLVGRNGSGKSTLIKLICGLLEPTEGNIFINNKNLKYYDFKESISTVFQDYYLFQYSIKKNIVLNDEDSKNFSEYANGLNLTDILKKCHNGYDTILGKEFDTNGIELSGGELQKIAIARACYKKDSLYIMDEPTSSLDIYTESFFKDQMKKLINNNTVIVVSHNLLVTKDCHQILVMEKGKIVEQGTHGQLMKRKKFYADMYQKNIRK